jgi:hypothetical protein
MIRCSLGCVWVVGVLSVCKAAEGPAVRAVPTSPIYCLGMPVGYLVIESLPADAVTLRFHVNVFYRNMSRRPLIIPTVFESTLVISRALRDVRSRRSQWTLTLGGHPSKVSFPQGNIETPLKPYFQVIEPNEEMSFETSVILLVHNPSVKTANTELLGKTIFLQLEQDHDRIQGDLSKLGDKWRDYGNLWFGKLRTEPIKVDIPASPATLTCQSEARID